MRLNLGAGTDIRKDFTNIDIRNLPGIDIVADISDLQMIESNSVEYIVAQHILEFIPRASLVRTLHEWKRVLEVNNGHLEIRVTDISLLTKAMYMNQVSKEMGLHHEMVVSLLYGKQSHSHDIRMNGFTSEYLQGILVGQGFQIVSVVPEDYDVVITCKHRISE